MGEEMHMTGEADAPVVCVLWCGVAYIVSVNHSFKMWTESDYDLEEVEETTNPSKKPLLCPVWLVLDSQVTPGTNPTPYLIRSDPFPSILSSLPVNHLCNRDFKDLCSYPTHPLLCFQCHHLH